MNRRSFLQSSFALLTAMAGVGPKALEDKQIHWVEHHPPLLRKRWTRVGKSRGSFTLRVEGVTGRSVTVQGKSEDLKLNLNPPRRTDNVLVDFILKQGRFK